MRLPAAIRAWRDDRRIPKLLAIARDGLCICRQGVVTYINPAGLELIGANEVVSVRGLFLADFVHPDYRLLCEDNFIALLSESRETPMKIMRRNGEVADVRVSVRRHPENIDDVVVSLRDISEVMRANREVAAQIKRLDHILETAADAIVVTDEAGAIQTFNRAAATTFGCPVRKMIGQPLAALFADSSTIMAVPSSSDPDQPPFVTGRDMEVTARRADGRTFPAEISLSICQIDKQRLYTAVIRDITERRDFEQNLAHAATHDALTGLPNRTLLQRHLHDCVEAGFAVGTFMAVWFVDLGGLKVVNDVLGHDAGDRLLIDAGQRMKEAVSPNDMVARFGGDEFALVLQGFHGEAEIVDQVGQFMNRMTSVPFQLKGREVTLNVTTGVAVYPRPQGDAADLLLDASAAMTFAKTGGHNQFRIFDPAMHRHSADRLSLENELRHGIERDEMVLHYQPQVEAATGRMVGLEALVRWRHPRLGLIPPARFIAIAEQTGLVVPLGAWVLRQACLDLHTLRAAGYGEISLAVNLSARQFIDGDVVALVQRTIADHDVTPNRLDLEITESMLMNDPEAVVQYLTRLKGLGVHLSIDDFGTGYSSLNYLKRFPVDTLKIDKSFVAEIASNPKDEAIAVTIITMAHAMGMTALAEGVEDHAQSTILLRHGCDVIQGFLYSKPQPFDHILTLLQRGPLLVAQPVAEVV